MTSPMRGDVGYPSVASATVTHASAVNSESSGPLPEAALWMSSAKSPENLGSNACASGSPNRTLYSMTLGPSAVSIIPA